MIKIIDKFEISIFTLEEMLEEIKSKSCVEIKQNDVEESFIKIYNSMKKYIHTPQQRKKAEEILEKYNQIQIMKDDREYPKGQIYKKPLYLDSLLMIIKKPLKINYR